MPVEKTPGGCAIGEAAYSVSLDQPRASILASIGQLDPAEISVVIVLDRAGTDHPEVDLVELPVLAPNEVAARLSPMTDAIKRVEANRVIETVDREQFRIVGGPLVLSVARAQRWVARAPSSPSPLTSLTLAALLSELVAIEPDLRVIALDPTIQDPNL